MKFLKFIIPIVVIVIIIIFANQISDKSYVVNTWDDWCLHLRDENLNEKYNATTIIYVDQLIRADFIKKYNYMAIDSMARQKLAGASYEDPVVQEWLRLKLVGVWSENDDIIVTDTFLEPEEFTNIANEFKNYLSIENAKIDKQDLNYCIYGTMNTHFKNFIFRGPENMNVTIPLDFSREEEF